MIPVDEKQEEALKELLAAVRFLTWCKAHQKPSELAVEWLIAAAGKLS